MTAETTTPAALGGTKPSPDEPASNRAMKDPAMAHTHEIPERLMSEAPHLHRQGRLEQDARSDPTTQTATADPQSDLRVAFEHHQAGRLAEAEAIYQKILETNRSISTACICWG